jgi:hypothetical protein
MEQSSLTKPTALPTRRARNATRDTTRHRDEFLSTRILPEKSIFQEPWELMRIHQSESVSEKVIGPSSGGSNLDSSRRGPPHRPRPSVGLPPRSGVRPTLIWL